MTKPFRLLKKIFVTAIKPEHLEQAFPKTFLRQAFNKGLNMIPTFKLNDTLIEAVPSVHYRSVFAAEVNKICSRRDDETRSNSSGTWSRSCKLK